MSEEYLHQMNEDEEQEGNNHKEGEIHQEE